VQRWPSIASNLSVSNTCLGIYNLYLLKFSMHLPGSVLPERENLKTFTLVDTKEHNVSVVRFFFANVAFWCEQQYFENVVF
jgi:hypothetical protein